MSQLTLSQVQEVESAESDWNRLIQLGGIAAWIQVISLLISFIAMAIVGSEPTTAEEYYQALNRDGLAGLLRLDFGTLILLVLVPFVAVGIYAVFRHKRQAYATLAMILILFGTVLCLADHSAFSIMHLSELYAAATTSSEQTQLLAAGEAVIATDMWHSTAGFLAGIFMQGGFAFISFVMLRSSGFSKWTAYSGILSNGFDFLHVFIGLFAPALAAIVLGIGGVFYLIWFPLLGWDLIRAGKNSQK
jgi:hypothetical protein